MRLTPTERDRLLLFGAAELARARRARGLRLNVPEATALIADTVCEAARDGLRLAEAIEAGRAVLGPCDVLPGVAEVVTEVQVEAVFEDGTRLAVVEDPIGAEDTNGADGPSAPGTPNDRAAAAGWTGRAGRTGAEHAETEEITESTETTETTESTETAESAARTRPGAVLPGSPAPAPPEPQVTVTVRNTASVPVSVTSHFHFFEANPRLCFDRSAAYGMRPAIPAGSSLRFEPGGTAEAGLVPIGGDRVAVGFAGLVDGPLDAPGAREEALRRAAACGYLGAGGEGGARYAGAAGGAGGADGAANRRTEAGS